MQWVPCKYLIFCIGIGETSVLLGCDTAQLGNWFVMLCNNMLVVLSS